MRRHFWLTAVATALLSLFLQSCLAPMRPVTDPESDQKARTIAYRAVSHNQDIVSAKGTGIIRIDTGAGTIQRYDIAWAARFPNQVRLTLMMSGLPVETIVSTGNKVTFISHTHAHANHTVYSSNPDLEKYIGVPVRLSTIITLLLGRVPVLPYDDAYFISGFSDEIVLWDPSLGGVQHLLMGTSFLPEGLDFKDKTAETILSAGFGELKKMGEHQIFSRLEMAEPGGKKLWLTIKYFKANPFIKETVFRLTGQGS